MSKRSTMRTYAEIADALGMTEDAVKATMRRAIAKLKVGADENGVAYNELVDAVIIHMSDADTNHGQP